MKYFRIKRRKEFEKILKSGKRAYAKTLTVVYLPEKEVRMAVCVGKKFGNSVERNRLKRLLREAFRTCAEQIAAPCAFLLIPRVRETYEYAAFTRDIGKILLKEKLLEA